MFRFLIELINPRYLFPKSSFLGGSTVIASFWGILAFTVFSGALRKWVVGEGILSSAIFSIQLMLPILFFIGIQKSPLPSLFKTPRIWPIYLFYLVVIAFNPMNQTLYHGALGFLLHTGYWLIWLAYLKKGSFLELEKFVPLLILILLVEFFLGGIQYSLPGNHWLNQYASGEDNNAIVGDAVRISGTFSYLGGFQGMIPLFACLAWWMMLQKSSSFLIYMVMIMTLIMTFMSGSRSALGFYAFYLFTALSLSGYLKKKFWRVVVQGAMGLALLVVFLPTYSSLLSRSYDNFMYRVGNSDQLDKRVSSGFEELIYFRGNYPLFGVGLGATYQGANALFGTSEFIEEYGYYESEPARIVLEGGFVLYFLNLIMIFTFLKNTRNLPLLAKVFFFIIYLNSMVTFNIYQGVFYVLGIMLVDKGYYMKNLQKEISISEKLQVV